MHPRLGFQVFTVYSCLRYPGSIAKQLISLMLHSSSRSPSTTQSPSHLDSVRRQIPLFTQNSNSSYVFRNHHGRTVAKKAASEPAERSC
jgi:hypothetical protein